MVKIDVGILKGKELKEYTSDELRGLAEPAHATSLNLASFYQGTFKNAVFRGMEFSECGFAKSLFERVSFYKCRFYKVDLVRTSFVRCFFFDCEFVKCDPYYASFENTEVNPAAFKRCYNSDGDWNKALVLFSTLRRTLAESGDGRLSRVADYYFREWQRRRLYHRWRNKQLSGFWPWFSSLCLWLLTGYGERPALLLVWACALISLAAAVYRRYFAFSIAFPKHGYLDYWYFSFRVFTGRAFTDVLQSTSLLLVQLTEFACGLVLIALFVGSVTRKLSP